MPETTRKKSSQKKGTSKKSTERGKKDVGIDEEFLRSEIVIILSFAVCAILFLSNFHLCGAAGDILRSVQLGIFGGVGYIAPAFFFAGILFSFSNKGNPRAWFKLLCVFSALISLSGFLELILGPGTERELIDIYKEAAAGGKGGGLLGGLLCWALVSAVGTAGAFLVSAALFIISAVCVTEKSFVSAVKKGGQKAYSHARENMDLRREDLEEKRRLRREEKIRGVNLEATKLEFPQEKPEEEGLSAPEIWEPPLPFKQEKELPPIKEGFVETSAYIKKETKTLEEMEVLEGSGRFFGSRAEEIWGDSETSKIYEKEFPVFVSEEKEEDVPPFRPDEVFKPVAASQEKSGALALENQDSGELLVVHQEIKKEYEADSEYLVTASGKMIESDAQVLQKKLEEKRREAREEGTRGILEERQGQEPEKEEVIKKEYIFPSFDLLKKGKATVFSDKEYRDTAMKLQRTLKNFGVGVTVTNISCGPSVTRYELHPEQGVKVSRIVSLSDDIKLNLAAADIRIEAPIPGKSAVGIEVPNKENHTVFLRDILESGNFKKHDSQIAFAVGKDIAGQVVVTDIAKMPHLLIAGATGSGKSVCINTLIMSILYKANPEEVKLIMIDPKVVELSVYNGIPHLLLPVVTDPKKASGALNWAVAEMTDRYNKFARYNVREIKGYNAKVESIQDIEDENKPVKMPQIVIIIDELADLMMVAPGEVEDAICRLAQLARAAGIHLVIATQRPSVNVITGLIKANVPSRIAFAVSSGVDSRTVIDMNGAEKLLGKGDMLFYPSGYPKPMRVQGAFVSDSEVSRVVEFLTEQGVVPDYNIETENMILSAPSVAEMRSGSDGRDEYFVQAGRFIIEKDKASIGMLQRMFKIGFNRAARIMDQLCEAGVVGEEEGTKPRKILMTMEEFEKEENPDENRY